MGSATLTPPKAELPPRRISVSWPCMRGGCGAAIVPLVHPRLSSVWRLFSCSCSTSVDFVGPTSPERATGGPSVVCVAAAAVAQTSVVAHISVVVVAGAEIAAAGVVAGTAAGTLDDAAVVGSLAVAE